MSHSPRMLMVFRIIRYSIRSVGIYRNITTRGIVTDCGSFILCRETIRSSMYVVRRIHVPTIAIGISFKASRRRYS